jgi:hypothetical protein
MRTGRILLKKGYASWKPSALWCDREALEEEIVTGGTPRSNDIEEEALCRCNRTEGIQQEHYAVSGCCQREENPAKDDQAKGGYQVAAG